MEPLLLRCRVRPRSRPRKFQRWKYFPSDASRFYGNKVWSPSSPLLSSVDEREVDKFSSLSSSWWGNGNGAEAVPPSSTLAGLVLPPGFEYNPLLSMNPARIKFLLQHFIDGTTMPSRRRPLSGARALDVGCGGGITSESLLRLGCETVLAIDPGGSVVEEAYRHGRACGLNVRMYHEDGRNEEEDGRPKIFYRGGCSVEEYAQEVEIRNIGGEGCKGDRYEIVTILEVIEHARDPCSIIAAASSLLRRPSLACPRGGLLVLSTINRTPESFAFAIAGAEYLARALPVGTHDWGTFLSPGEVRSLAEASGLEEVATAGMVVKACGRNANCGPLVRWELDEGNEECNWIGAYRLREG